MRRDQEFDEHAIEIRARLGKVLSACVQMPSLQSVQVVEDRLDLPVLSVSVATVWDALLVLDLNPRVPDCGMLLSGEVVDSPRVDR